MKKLLTLSALTAALLSSAHAEPKISAQSIIVNPTPTNVNVRVWTDRDASGTNIPAYAPGERIRLYTSVAQDAYVYLFNVDPNGQVDLILPNRFQGGANFVKAGTVKAFPAAGDPFSFDIAAPYGVNKVLAVASRTPLNLDQIATFKTQQNSFATVNVQGQQQLAQALSIVVNPVQQDSWDSATAYYQVVSRGAAVPFRAPAAVAPVGGLRPDTVAVQPAPAAAPTATALSITVNPARPAVTSPWGDAKNWRVTLDARTDLRQVHDQYAAQLRAEGYTLMRTQTKNNELESEFRSGDVRWASLSVKRKGNRIEVTLERHTTIDRR